MMSAGRNDGVRPRAVAGVVLAAGLSSRMEQPKLLLPLAGQTMLGCTLANALAGGVKPLTVVCGAAAESIAAEAEAKGLPWLFNADYAQGQSFSLRCGLAAVPAGFGLMYILGDMPFVRPASYAALLQAYANSDALIVAPLSRAGQRGNPTIFAPQLFAEIEQLSGDIGARALIEKHREQVLLLPLADEGLYLDIDTPEDYERVATSE